MLKKFLLASVLFLCGCYSLHIPDSFSYKEIITNDFKLASWQNLTDTKSPVKIYIEGDGAAFDAYGRPTRNPTPKGTLLREIAFNDYSPNVVYLARPCQFVDDAKCVQKYWTTARFAEEVIRAEAFAISQIAQGREVILIGFSGGAQVAGLVSVLYPNIKVKKLITIGGNLNHKAWTDYYKLPALKDSLDLADYKDKYLLIPQEHYVGLKDDVIPAEITRGFVKSENIKEIPSAKHNTGWEDIYALIWAEQ